MSGTEISTYGEQFGEPFQRHMLAVATRVPGFILRFRTALNANYFTSKIHRLVASAILDHVDVNQKLPTRVTLFEEAKARTDEENIEPKLNKFLDKLYGDDISDAQAVMAKTIEFGKLQAMVNAVLVGAEQIQKGDRNILPLIHEASLVGEDILNIGTDFKDGLDDRIESYLVADDVENDDIIPTGIPHLDYALDGGISRGELAVVLAPPKRGKSTTLINIGFGGLACVLGYNVVHYTMEMSEKKVIARYDDRAAGYAVKYKKVAPQKFTDVLSHRIKKLVRGRLFVKGYPTRTATPTTIRTHLSLLMSRGFIPDMVIVDYADIVKAERRLGEMRHEQAGIYEDLRQLAGEFNVAVWTGSQAPRGALEKESLTLADFAEAFEKAAIIDACAAFCQSASEKIDGICRIVLAGLRNQEDGRVVRCRIQRDRCKIRSYELLDSAHVPVPTPYDDDEDDDMPPTGKTKVLKTTVTKHEAKQNIKALVQSGADDDGQIKVPKKGKKKITKKV